MERSSWVKEACHAKRRGVNSTQDVRNKVSHLSRKSTLRSRKRHTCHAKRRGVNSTQDVRQLPPTSIKVYKGPHLLRKSTLRARKCHACHAKRRGLNSTQASADLYEGVQSATPVTQIDPEVSKAPRLSLETPRRQFDPGCLQASADLYEGLQSVTPVTQSPLLFHASSSNSCFCFSDEDEREEEEADGEGRVQTKTPQHNVGKKQYIAKQEFAHKICLRRLSSVMPKAFLCYERAFCCFTVVVIWPVLMLWNCLRDEMQ